MRWMYWLPGAVLLTAPVALAQTPEATSTRSFTATVASLSGAREPRRTNQLIVRGDMMHSRKSDEPMGVLFDFGKGKVWILLPEQKVAIESKLTRSMDFGLSFVVADSSGNPCGEAPDLTCTREGEETVAGRPAVKWRIAQSGKDKKTRTATAWVDAKLRAVVRIASEKGEGFELRDLQEGPVDEALVQFPAGFLTVDEKNLHHDEPEPTPKPKKKGTAPPKKP